MLVKLLIIFLLYLIVYSTLVKKNYEGMVNQNSGCNQENISVLTYKNAGQIQTMQENMAKLDKLPSQVDTNTKNIKTIANQLVKLMQTQQNAAHTLMKPLPSS